MPFNGSGIFNRVYNWVTDKANSVLVTASRMDGEDDGFATGLSNCMTRDGQSPPTANIPMGGFKLTGLADGTVATDSMAYGQFLSKTQLQVTKNGNQTLPFLTVTQVTSWTVQLDTLSEWDVPNQWWVCGVTGVYLITNTVILSDTVAASTLISMGIDKNNALTFLTANGYALVTLGAIGEESSITVSRIASLTAGDTISMIANATTATVTIPLNVSSMSILRVG